ncbi:hypothetical protein LSAT2_004835, partial [Lamellibrachia satsuma]
MFAVAILVAGCCLSYAGLLFSRPSAASSGRGSSLSRSRRASRKWLPHSETEMVGPATTSLSRCG